MKRYKSLENTVFDTVVMILLLLCGLLCLLPLLHVISLSLSSKTAALAGRVYIWPVEWTTSAYTTLMKDNKFMQAMAVSLKRVALGGAINFVLTICTAFPLSMEPRQFPARRVYIWIFVFAMLFGASLVPWYFVIKRTGLIDTIWALVIPGAVPVFNIILVQNFMKGLPDEISESAFIDGAGHWRTLFEIILPLSKASLATVTLFCAVSHWNAYFDGMLYMNKSTNYPLQTYLRSLVIIEDFNLEANAEDITKNVTQESSRCAQIFVAMVPILCVYPFLQKHFTKGIVMGSVKG